MRTEYAFCVLVGMSGFDINNEFEEYMNYSCINSIYLEPITEGEIRLEINKLGEKKSPGPDDKPPNVMKHACDQISKVLCHL